MEIKYEAITENNKQNNKHIIKDNSNEKFSSTTFSIAYRNPFTIQYTGLNFDIRPHGYGSQATDQNTPPSIVKGIKIKVVNTPI